MKKSVAPSTNTGYTPGPWGWFGSSKHGMYLATEDRGRIFVMGFKRLGMSGAQPQFQVNHRMVDGKDLAIYEVCPEATRADDERVYRHDIIGFRSPDATLIAAAPDLLVACEAALNARMFKDWPEVATLLMKAIAKAKGETNAQ